uniref:Uncharacterized protein n=1 Tax=Ditylenchus dipsaci TaxID=166011 RepID=A0A915DRB3_9BILA
MHRCNLCFSDVVMGAEFDELYKLVGSQDYVSVVAQLSPEMVSASVVDSPYSFALSTGLRSQKNMRGFKKIVLLVTSVEHKARVENKVDERRRGSDI